MAQSPEEKRKANLDAVLRYQAKNREKIRKYARNWNNSNASRYRQFIIDYKSGKSCTDCGVAYPHYVLQFDHVRGKKEFNVSESVNRPLAVLEAEIAKCEIVCANCHSTRTYARLQERKQRGEHLGRPRQNDDTRITQLSLFRVGA